MGGEEAERQWRALERRMQPLQVGAALLPAAAIRGDLGIALTAGRYGPGLIRAGLVARQLTGPFSGALQPPTHSLLLPRPLRLTWLPHARHLPASLPICSIATLPTPPLFPTTPPVGPRNPLPLSLPPTPTPLHGPLGPLPPLSLRSGGG